jgi:phosphatidylserine/phosphatidylglycerophosphate/cardiolipin synthase-like enzyme
MSPSLSASMPPSSSSHSSSIIQQWLSSLEAESPSDCEDPSYYQSCHSTLVTTSIPQSFSLGNGLQILSEINSSILCAQHEVIFVTCFWAASASRDAFCEALKRLSACAGAENRRIRVYIGISSLSFLQKLTQTSSLNGKLYPPSSWVSVLGLPSPDELRGLDLEIRSIFVLPFSVMHTKFCVVDRKTLFMPSCNVSWENWLEGCVKLQGDVVSEAVRFWCSFWRRGLQLPDLVSPVGTANSDRSSDFLIQSAYAVTSDLELGILPNSHSRAISNTTLTPLLQSPIQTLFLPSPHHMNPLLRPFSRTHAPPPSTPLNIFLLTLFTTAKERIYIQSPNINSPPVISALQDALKRGVDIKIVTNTRMMVPEQLVTAGRLTEWAMSSLYKRWLADRKTHNQQSTDFPTPQGDLQILYYSPPLTTKTNATQGQSGTYCDNPFQKPSKSHIKLTIVDNSIVVLGSGNMDRASWYTSQELGIAFFSRDFAYNVLHNVEEAAKMIGMTRFTG